MVILLHKDSQFLFLCDRAAINSQSAQYDAQSKANGITAAQNSAAIKWETYNRKLAEANSLKDKYNLVRMSHCWSR